ncbi:MAG: hypothetical protein Q8P32_02515 [Candidatus Komeilibacteria bacterium]|nr:hypothetical protein [Candidatus Komeilibacteria bacterium]
MGNDSIDFSLNNLWRIWYRFRRGKHASREIDEFSYHLEEQLSDLHHALTDQSYHHGSYRRVTITDNKRRDLAVAIVRDRVVHRLLYDYLVKIFDQTFIYDAWSCRKGKGLLGAITRAADFSRRLPRSWVWRADIKKFFDHVDQDVLKRCLRRRVNDPNALWLLDSVIDSYALPSIWPAAKSRERERERERVSHIFLTWVRPLIMFKLILLY